MADDVEFGHVVDLTLGEAAGTELVADAAIGATTLTVDYAGDFEDAGEVYLNGAVLPYTSITYGDAETDPDIITLAAPLAAAALTDDKVGMVSGGEPVTDWLLHVSLGDGHPVDIPIPFEQRAMWSSVDTATPVPVLVSADLSRLVEVPGRTPIIDGAAIDPATLPPIPGGQTISDDAPTDTTGYPEDYGWWQVDGAGDVVGFWRLVAGVWTPQTIVTAEALQAGNILADAIDATDLTGVNINGTVITGPLIRTSASGNRLELNDLDQMEFFTGDASETAQGRVTAAVSGGRPSVDLQSPRFGTGTSSQINLRGPGADGSGLSSTLQMVAANILLKASTQLIISDGTTNALDWNVSGQFFRLLNGADLRSNAGGWSVDSSGNGSVGTGTFRDSVRSAVSSDTTAWTTYTPTFTAASTNPTLGNFTRSGRYARIGRNTVAFSVVITCNAASGFGSGSYAFGLPVAARQSEEVVVSGIQTGPAHNYIGRCAAGGSTSEVFMFLTSTDGAMNSTSSGMASGTVIRISGTYEAA